jgi:acetyl esterase/lipase
MLAHGILAFAGMTRAASGNPPRLTVEAQARIRLNTPEVAWTREVSRGESGGHPMAERSKPTPWRAIAACLLWLGAIAGVDTAARAQTAFYSAAGVDLGRYPPGGLIRQQPILGAPDGAAAYRVLYRSTGLRGEPIAVSGVVIIPAGEPPAGGRPVVAWAHPTTGVVPACAPSLARVLFSSIQGLREMLAAGYVVAATDYPGLGVSGPHPYLVGESEGRAVLDSVRAARVTQGSGAGTRFAAWGHSQGGQAALFTGLLSRSYAPELTLVGVAAAAPATELATLMGDDLDSDGGRNLTAMTLWSWQRVYGAPMSRLLTPEAIPNVDRLAGLCIERAFDMFTRRGPTKALARSFLRVDDPAKIEPWRELLESNTPGALAPNIPIFLAQGDADKLVIPAVTRDYMGKLCAAGSRVRLLTLPGVGHGFSGRDSAAAAVTWMTARFSGEPAPSDCGGL